MLGETLEPRSMFAVSASLSSGTLSIALSAAGDAAFLSIIGSSYVVADGPSMSRTCSTAWRRFAGARS
jgi:hypothetical protein